MKLQRQNLVLPPVGDGNGDDFSAFPSKQTLRRADPQVAPVIGGKRVDPTYDGIIRRENGDEFKMFPIKTRESILCADPEKTVRGLGNDLDGVAGMIFPRLPQAGTIRGNPLAGNGGFDGNRANAEQETFGERGELHGLDFAKRKARTLCDSFESAFAGVEWRRDHDPALYQPGGIASGLYFIDRIFLIASCISFSAPGEVQHQSWRLPSFSFHARSIGM